MTGSSGVSAEMRAILLDGFHPSLVFTHVGEQRRLKPDDVLDERDRGQRESEEWLRALPAMAQEAGSYQWWMATRVVRALAPLLLRHIEPLP